MIVIITFSGIIAFWALAQFTPNRTWHTILLQFLGQLFCLAFQNRAFKVSRMKQVEELRAALRGHSTDNFI